MDADRFDAVTRSLVDGVRSRRAVLQGLAGGGMAALAALFGFADAAATHYGCRHVGEHCQRKGQCCSGVCRGPAGKMTCRSHNKGTCTPAKDYCINGCDNGCASGGVPGCGAGTCNCYYTTGGTMFCSSGFGICMVCFKDAECERALGIPGSACVECSCNFYNTACKAPCTTSA